MKIVAGLGCIDDYVRLVKAGADEVFCGYVPNSWNKKYGSLFPLNRREVLFYNVNIGPLEDMKILKRMVNKYKVPVTITFNYLYYLEEQYPLIEKIITDLINVGFNEFIIADIGLLLYLKERKIECIIHLSGETAEINSLSIDFFNQFNISRYIFHRKNTIEDMKSCINNNKVKNLEYESFCLNERCHYTGAFCNSLHCDEMSHLCMMFYDFAKVDKNSNHFELINDKMDELDINSNDYLPGKSGCGICALQKLKQAGITHLKVVGRGNSIDNMEKDVAYLRKAINILENIKNNQDYEKIVRKELFNNKCSKECYYLTDN